MQQTISEAARLYGKARSTIHRAIASGRLSCSVRGDGVRVIQLAELIRLWGEPKHRPPETQQDATPSESDTQQAMLREMQAMRRELFALREEVAELRRLPAPWHVASASQPAAAEPSEPPPAADSTPALADPPTSMADVLARFESRQTRH